MKSVVEEGLASEGGPPTERDPALEDVDRVGGLVGGRVLGQRYEIRAPLGAGGMGTVFRAYDRATQMTVALKVMRAERVAPGGWLAQLGQEVRAGRMVNHPNVCRIFDLAEADGETFYTMELAPGGSLRRQLRNRRPRPPRESIRDSRAVTAGVAAMHAAGLVHGDLKPENVLRMPDGRLVVSDFGLARDAALPGRTDGTPGYMAPELASTGSAGAPADVWALGVLLYELALGERPEPTASAASNAAVREWRLEKLLGLCSQCMRLQPEARPTAAAVLDALTDIDGETLEERLGRQGWLSTSRTLALAKACLESLAAVHRRGDVHGNLVADAIFLAGGHVERARLVPGTRRGGAATARTAHDDLRNLGGLLLRCLLGREPTPTELMADPAVLEAVLPKVPTSVVAHLHRALTAAPGIDAAALAADVSALQSSNELPVAAAALTGLVREKRLATVVCARGVSGSNRDLVEDQLQEVGVEYEVEGDDLVVVLTDGGPSDQAMQAARLALTIKGSLPSTAVAVASGHRRAAIARAEELVSSTETTTATIQDATAALIESRFVIERGATTARLLRERGVWERPRTVLGKELPCVGRDRELAILDGLFDECVSEPVARVVLVTAPAGGGKSRLQHEFLQRLDQRGERFLRFIGRGDSLRSGAPFAMLGPALRDAAGVVGGETAEQQRGLVQALAAKYVDGDRSKRTAAFLGELAGVPFPDDYLPVLASARQDARLMSDQLLSCWLDWMEGVTSTGPVILILEDLHWGDSPSIKLVDHALRALRESPLMVLALARPEIDARFPSLWADREPQRMTLPRLTPRSSHRLLDHALGDRADTARWMIARADGNPFFLEELLRSTAAGAREAGPIPESIIGTIQTRLDGFPSEARQVLRAASVFGERFSAAGVRAVLSEGGAAVDRWLDTLVARELIYHRHGDAIGAYAFRHALIREASYETLTIADKTRSHLCAAEWLEREAPHDAWTLVEHFERGGDHLRAAHHCVMAAQQTLDANDAIVTLERVERGLRNGASGTELATLRAIEAQARVWRGEYVLGEAAARAALGTADSVVKVRAIKELILALGQQTKLAEVGEWTDRLRDLPFVASSITAHVEGLVRGATYLQLDSKLARAEEILRRLKHVPSGCATHFVQGMVSFLEAFLLRGQFRFQEVLLLWQAAYAAFAESGDSHCMAEMAGDVGSAFVDLGQFEESVRWCTKSMNVFERLRLDIFTSTNLANLAQALFSQGRFSEAEMAVHRGARLAREQGDCRYEGICLVLAARISLALERNTEAEDSARAAVKVLIDVPTFLPVARAVLAQALMAQKRLDEASAHAKEAYCKLEHMGYVEDGELLIRLIWAEVLAAQGEAESALRVLAHAHEKLIARAELIKTSDFRKSFLSRIPEHARILQLAQRWGVDS